MPASYQGSVYSFGPDTDRRILIGLLNCLANTGLTLSNVSVRRYGPASWTDFTVTGSAEAVEAFRQNCFKID
ncbi:MAG: hypothetical protein KGS72_23445 [Cyanobacteria bacterium REEB67]|nr:hypothetical protein [Cyanobacteria bacterium REEB67]